MGMRVKRTKDRVLYSYTGELQDSLDCARKELDKKLKSQDLDFLRWQLEKAKKAYDAYERRIFDLQEFIRLAEKELMKKENVSGEGESV